jgi:hypothetical protein
MDRASGGIISADPLLANNFVRNITLSGAKFASRAQSVVEDRANGKSQSTKTPLVVLCVSLRNGNLLGAQLADFKPYMQC